MEKYIYPLQEDAGDSQMASGKPQRKQDFSLQQLTKIFEYIMTLKLKKKNGSSVNRCGCADGCKELE